ncbi:permease prefix domain 1-containing protein [Peribacillus frigoritolerans]|uniref:permease prefix domain 1-containing protein n=1 Tax=Peribacillus frigoritolerans TaxID=450367 RepID=UPI0020BF1B5D|nr:permease prefix domain 1-containing protein [Peribacillus frigoritolerans]MCK2001538.1 permease prefix domain 1-containing protein [Peribacillus frigoritolerans]MEE3951173.1 permease prefix domain 1-containing protein [Peribacillus frigoritolerans]
MKQLMKHVNELFKDVPESEQKETVIQEVLQNLEEKVWDLMEQGKVEEDAINKAIIEFGDAEDLKNELGVKQLGKPTKKNNTKLNLEYSIWGSVLIISLLVFINFYYSPHVIWFVYPTFAVLWWPLTMHFRWKKVGKEE